MKVKVHEVFPWKKIVEAHEEMEANKNTGKVSYPKCFFVTFDYLGGVPFSFDVREGKQVDLTPYW